MIMKSLIAVAAVATIAAGASAPANAKVNVDVFLGGINPGYGYYDPGYPVYVAPVRPRHYDYEDNYSYGISCEEGRDTVRDSGYRKVRAISCSGKRYTYRARQGGRTFIVKVSRRSGDIVSVRQDY